MGGVCLAPASNRTEAQMRAALHAHILCWFRLRADPHTPRPGVPKYKRLDSVPREAPGTAPKQRPSGQTVEPLRDSEDKLYVHEDDMYHRAEMARVTAEMVRPDVSGGQWGGYSVEKLRIAGLARAIQSRLLLHVCSPKYCLQDRSTCRFFSLGRTSRTSAMITTRSEWRCSGEYQRMISGSIHTIFTLPCSPLQPSMFCRSTHHMVRTRPDSMQLNMQANRKNGIT